MKNINLNQFTTIAWKGLRKLQDYIVFISIISILLIYSFLVFKIGVVSQAEPDPTVVMEQANTVKRLKLDQDAILKIQQLEDQNIGVKSLFESARDNPFQN